MCGLFGAIGNVASNKELIRALAVLNMTRGKDSTGFFSLRQEPTEGNLFRAMMKVAEPAYVAIKDDNFPRLFENGVYAVCGHVRAATMGSVCTKNAHPFTHGNTVGSHNGVVHNVGELKKTLGATYDVDSNYLIHLIDTKESVEEAAGSINLVWNKIDDSLGASVRIARHDNSLYYATDDNGECLIYSSDDDDLQYAMAIVGLKWKVQPLSNDNQMPIWCENGKMTRFSTMEFKCKTHGGHRGNYND